MISSATSPQERDMILEKFQREDDSLSLLIATGSFVLGFDNPLIHTIYVTCPISLQLRFQLTSMLSRPYESKKEGLIVDYVGLDWVPLLGM